MIQPRQAEAIKPGDTYKGASEHDYANELISRGHRIRVQSNAGNRYEQGVSHLQGKHRDDAKAFSCFAEAARQWHTQAQLHLGACYDNGIGIAKNPVQAYRLYNMAANRGNMVAMYHQAICLAVGSGIDIDLKKASEVLEKTANSGDALAHCTLGFCFEQKREKAKSDKHYQKVDCHVHGYAPSHPLFLATDDQYKFTNKVDIYFQKGKLFEEGIFFAVNLEQAIACSRRTQTGNPAAQSALTRLRALNPELFSPSDVRDNETKSADSNDAENVIRTKNSSSADNSNRYRLFCPRSLQRLFCSRSCIWIDSLQF